METNNPNNARAGRGLHTTNPDRVRTEALIEEALAWRRYATSRTTLSEVKLTRKTLEGLAFSLQVGANHFALPSKLTGTAARQPAIGDLLKEDVRFGTQLDAIVRGQDLVVMYKSLELGLIQAKHTPWLRSLITRGAGVHLTGITGLNGRGYCGLNVAFSRVGLAAIRAEKALREMAVLGREDTAPDGPGGDGQVLGFASGDGQQAEASVPEVTVPEVTPTDQGLHLAVSRCDVRLWRAANGTAHLSVPHVCVHSPTGIDWGRLGAGPKDAALSVLCAFTDVVRAERLAHDFTREVISRIPYEGGIIPAAFIAQWLLAHADDRV